MQVMTPVLALRSMSPDIGRTEIELPAGLTLAEIASQALPGLDEAGFGRVRMWLVSNAGETLIPDRRQWATIRPRAGVRVVIRLAPGDDSLRNVLLIAVSVAATAIGQFYVGPAIAAATGSSLLGQVGAAVAVAGLTVVGGQLVNWLIPPPGQQGGREGARPLYSISGWQNQARPDGVVPSVFGKVRVAPTFAAPSYMEIVGDNQYVRALFTFGYGPIALSDIRIKDTPIDKFDEVEYEVRQGHSGDDPVTLYPSQVIEDSLGVELRRDRERDDAGNITGTGPITTTTRFTAGDTTEASAIFHFPSGLIQYEDSGDAASREVQVRIRQRPAAGGAWQTVKAITFRNKKREGFFRQYRWTLPSRGRWEIEIARITHEAVTGGSEFGGGTVEVDGQVADRVSWLALQSFRPEYPLNFGDPLCLLAVRVKATYQLNSTLDTLNAVPSRLMMDWDHVSETWVERETSNPAAHYRHVLQGPENAYRDPDSAIDLNQLQDWHDFCRLKGLKYDRNRDFEASKWDALTEIAAAGRASPRFDGTKWGVVIDRPQAMAVAHINARNSRSFTWRRGYLRAPHAFRVPFLDATADYQQRERIVRWPGHVGEITLTEQLDLPGKTDPDEIWIEARRRQYERIHRPDTFEAIQDGAVRTATRGDFVKASHEFIARTMAALKVSAVRDHYVTLDGHVEMTAGTTYALRFMRQVGEGDDATFESVVRKVMPGSGRTDSIALQGAGDVPARDEIVHFGVHGEESLDLVIAGTQSGEGRTSVVQMLAQATVIDDLTDAEVPPAWNGRAGGDASADISVPAIPRVVSTEPYFDGSGNADGLTVLLEPGAGSSTTVATFTLRHRLEGTSTWAIVEVDAADGAAVASGYASGDTIEMQRLATSIEGYSSDWSAIFTAEGAIDPSLPAPSPVTSGSVSGGVGEVDITYSTPNDDLVAGITIFYGPNSDGSGTSLLVSDAADPSTAYARTETVGAGTFYFFIVTTNSEGTASAQFALGQATIT